ncbi:Zn-dependent oxidoreductase [Mycolicibacterium conceptionense]|uniref:Zn-dependent oxidoreductase n=1 Tax=Mycolicibacterium conceptionense TaxID=451644 RepID=A0A0U1DWV9_9MYCO|nr:Zn-dependent oxidoreductase [Mycolicibacterium conceptionense]
MRAAVCPWYGPPGVVRIEDVPAPPLEPGQVRVKVGAAAVNFPDVLLVADKYQIHVPVPFIPGSEFAGVVAEVASDTDDFAVGDRVTGTGLFGAFAEQVCVATPGLARIPDGVDDRTAAAFGVAHRTAYHTLRSMARIQPNDDVIVLGAGGGVGLRPCSSLRRSARGSRQSPHLTKSSPPLQNTVPSRWSTTPAAMYVSRFGKPARPGRRRSVPSRRCGRCAAAAGS